MPTITFRVTAEQRARIEARAASLDYGLSDYIRHASLLYDLPDDAPDLAERVEDHERRLSALEEMADAGR
jgi:predicted component of type VI protein secretion system